MNEEFDNDDDDDEETDEDIQLPKSEWSTMESSGLGGATSNSWKGLPM